MSDETQGGGEGGRASLQTFSLPQKKSGEETTYVSLLPIFSERGGTSVHRLGRA